MRHTNKKRSIFSPAGFALVPVLVLTLICFTFTACGNGEKEEVKPAEQTTGSTPAAKAESTPAAPPAAESGWKTYTWESYSIAIPEAWASDLETNLFWPGSGNTAMGLPPVCAHIGGMPLMPGTTFEDRIKSYHNAESTLKEPVTVGGMAGLKCGWELMGKKHLAVFLEEKVGGGVGVIHFADCRAPTAEFDSYKAQFEKIINSFRITK